ncbi:MAG: helix-turn-helix domain-containing protein [Lachnospiraceae bacterium]|nr:helix-turn-helix domain-containing protein [Lachnospiraceae bacterium]
MCAVGRPPKYDEWLTEDGLLTVEGWARDGLTDEQIAHNCGITATTLYEWKKRFPEFSEAIKRGKRPVDILVENALLKRAMGFAFEEKTIEKDSKGNVKEKIVKKYIVPDTRAAEFWLKNRKPEIWRAHPEPVYTVEYEDDGLMDALDASIDDIYSSGDDSDSLNLEDDEL